jgi:glycosyltransferase involved in cell wall biosynthesis
MSSATDRPLGDPSIPVQKRFPHSRPGAANTERDADSLYAAFENYLTNTELLNLHSRNALQMAEALFDRETTYPQLAEFILDSSFRV